MAYYISTILFVIVVVYLVLRKKDKGETEPDPEHLRRIKEFKANADAFALDFDKCTFKDSSYVTEEEQDTTHYNAALVLVGGGINSYYTPVERVETVQSVLFYEDEKQLGKRRFIQTFPMDQTTLKLHVVRGNVTLYIDKERKKGFFFDIISK